jgi:hypothetical protein
MKNKFNIGFISKSIVTSIIIGLIVNVIFRTTIDKVIDKKINISFDVKLDKDDEFQVFYNDFRSFNETSSQFFKTIGGQNSTHISLEIPYCDTATYIRIDPGHQSENHKIAIENLIIKAGSNGFIIGKHNFKTFFTHNDFITSTEGSNYTLVLNTTKRQNLWSDYDPFIISKNLNKLLTYQYEDELYKINMASLAVALFVLLVFMFSSIQHFHLFSALFLSAIVAVLLFWMANAIASNVIEKTLKLSFDVKVNYDDEFQVFYTSKEGIFKEENSIKSPVFKAKTNHLQFEIPYNDTATFIRIDPGVNRDNKEIAIENIVLSAGAANIKVGKDFIESYFSKNGFIPHINYNFNSVNLTTTTLKGLWSEYDPFLQSKNLNTVIIYNKPNLSSYVFYLIIIIGILTLSFFVHYFTNFQSNDSKFFYKNTINSLGGAIFIIVILLPFFDQQFSIYASLDENRAKPQEVIFNIREINTYPSKFSKYYEENFGFRTALIHLRSFIYINVFHESPTPNKVVFGKNGWMFHNDPNDYIVKDFTHTNLLSETQLQQLVVNYKNKKHTLDTLGIKYYRTFYPNTHTVYPENFNYKSKLLIKGNISRADQIIAYFNSKQLNNAIIDHRPLFATKKATEKLYLKHDTHWNQLAAFYAYNNIIKNVNKDFPQVKPLQKEQFNIKNIAIKGGDLVNLMGTHNPKDYTEVAPIFYPKSDSLAFYFENPNFKRCKYFENNPTDYQSLVISTINPKANNKLKVLIFRDSFTKALYTFMSSQFYQVIYVWGDFNMETVKTLKPNIVIESKVERIFYDPNN